MYRSMFQTYVKGSAEAVRLYQEAFGAKLGYHVMGDGGVYYHAELDIEGQVLAVAEAAGSEGERVTGNTMQLCLHYGEGGEGRVKKAYEVLQRDGEVLYPLGPCEFSSCMCDLIDAFGVRWCLFV